MVSLQSRQTALVLKHSLTFLFAIGDTVFDYNVSLGKIG
jgi:hypothetical protein